MADKINLIGHDNTNKWLEKTDNNHYKLCGDLVDYTRFMVDESGNYVAFDPPGGPMMYLGDTIPNTELKIKKINITDENVIIEV